MKVAYLRVSTERQADEGISLDSQESKVNFYAGAKDWTIDEIIRDEGESAKTLNRPGMLRLIEMIKQGQINTVIVAKLDRLTRSTKDLGGLLDLFEKYHVALVSLSESIDATTASGRLMINLLCSVAQWEREIISERTKDALAELKRQGKSYSRPTFQDQESLNLMQEYRAQGMTYSGIADEMNRQAIPTARGGQWRASTVHVLLSR